MLFFGRRNPDHLATSFSWLDRKPFAAVQAESYAARYESRAFVLALRRDSLFAWETLRDEKRYTDFVLDAEVESDPSNGHSAVGLIFRHVSDENFYSFLLSSRGNFRVDALFNNHPLRILEWTKAPEPDPEGRRAGHRLLRVIGRGSRLSFHVDDEWVAETEDELLPEGTVGFAAQNFAGSGPGLFRLRRLEVQASAVVVEREHLRSWYYAPVSPAARLRLAETLYAAGRHHAAAIQLRRGLKDREGTARERFLLAECLLALSLHDEALAEIDKVLAQDPGYAGARLERANILYLSNRLAEARDWLADGFEKSEIPRTAAALNLLGNAEYGLGNWDRAAEAYGRAAEQEPDVALFSVNAARALERTGRTAEAVGHYQRAARRLYQEEAFDELSLVLPRLRALAPQDPDTRALEARVDYREGKKEEALAALRDLEEAGSRDSAVHYLLGLLLAEMGSRAEALPRFIRAAELEPDYPLYHFRVAETQHLLGRDPRESLDRARALAPDDPWANNLEGQLRMDAGDPQAAVAFFRVARDAAPREEAIALNLAEALSRAGRAGEAQEAVDALEAAVGESARTTNQRGNMLARSGDHAGAVAAYESAIRQDPSNPVYKENCAAACLELDMVHRAEELLAQVEPDHPSASVYNLLGQVAVLKGERARAEAAFSAGLERDPDNPDIAVNLALLNRDRGRHEAARDLLLRVLASHPDHARARTFLDRFRAERETRLQCSTCGREWWVPRDLPPQPALRVRGEPPADAPAGRCPACSRLYCVGCAASHVRQMRFFCPEDGEFLRLSEDALKWLLTRALDRSAPSTGSGA
ncbi:MAG TPA: tetratricopeptide repeat protein [Spirochaetia bacterium]|nr:tetratricopeptide repeat protein [Spirochaetia bacterium]